MATNNPQPPPPILSIPPSAFDTLPELTALLTRLKPPVRESLNSIHSPAPVTGTTPLPAPPEGDNSLTLKQFSAATDPLKHALQRARQQVRELPDIKRSVEDQEKEIEKLEERKRKQKDVLRQLHGMGVRFGRGDGNGNGGVVGSVEVGKDTEMVMR